MSRRTVTAKIGAYFSNPSRAKVLRSGTAKEIVDDLSFSVIDMSGTWIRVGEAEITATIDVDEQQILAGQVEQLREKQRRVDAEAVRVKTEIEREIQSLLAITCEQP